MKWDDVLNQMNTRVFLRLLQAFEGRTVELLRDCYLGGQLLTQQFNTGFEVDAWTLHGLGVVDLDRFERKTERWVEGRTLFGGEGTLVEDVAKNVTRMGVPPLPADIDAKHYTDPETNVTMRAEYVFNIELDLYTVRYDIICGYGPVEGESQR